MNQVKEIAEITTQTENVDDGVAKNSFLPGYEQIVGEKDSLYAKAEIMFGLKIKSEGAWRRRLYGEISPTLEEVIIVNEALAKFGVTKNRWS